MSTRADQWATPTTEHTFRTGRTARLRQSLSIIEMSREAQNSGDEDVVEALVLMSEGKLENGPLAMRLTDAICRAMFVEPRLGRADDPDSTTTLRVALEDIIAADHGKGVQIARDVLAAQPVPLAALNDDEITETVELALEGLANAARFRADADGDGDGAAGEGVGPEPVAEDGAAPGVDRGAGAGPPEPGAHQDGDSSGDPAGEPAAA